MFTLHIIVLVVTAVLPTFRCEDVIIDTDAGADDGMAIALSLLSYKNFKIKAITCVRGNAETDDVANNVLKVLDTIGRLDVPVYKGSPTGLVNAPKFDNYFGKDGFGDFQYPYNITTKVSDIHAAIFLADYAKKNPGNLTIICIGPLTNIALATHLNPDFLKQVQLHILGGSRSDAGNMGPGIEFNMYADSAAASFVFRRISSANRVKLVTIETVQYNPLPMSWRLRVLGSIMSNTIKLFNMAERIALKGKNWSPYDQTLAATYLWPKITTHQTLGLPEVDPITGRMRILYGATAEIITSVDMNLIQHALLENLSKK